MKAEKTKEIVATIVQNAVLCHEKETQDRKDRETILIIFNMEKNSSHDDNAQLKEDEQFFTGKEVWTKSLDVPDFQIKKMFRLGKRSSNSTDKVRPVKVIFDSVQEKRSLSGKCLQTKICRFEI